MVLLGGLAGTVASRSLRRRPGAAGPPAPIEAESSARPAASQGALDDTAAKLRSVTARLGETRAELDEARAEVRRLSDRAKAMSDRAETEMGRMESAAIAALESTAASNRQEVAGLRELLAAAEDAARALQAELDAERGRSEQLQSALTGRDTELAGLRASIRDSRGRRA
jgi:predicted  nucleic acid-binding Zn-ribbon protein